jgi:hypothetical protein
MSVLRHLSVLTLISCGLVTAGWSATRGPSLAHAEAHMISKPAARTEVVWIDTRRN